MLEGVKSSKSRPIDLSNKLVLGAFQYGGNWYTRSVRVTNLNVFSSLMSKEKMKSVTKGGSCGEEGDYLAWGDMEWILLGQTRIETVDKEESCQVEPYVNFFFTSFPGMDACMHHCQNLETRAPSVIYPHDWASLNRFLKKNLYDKGLNTLSLWLPVIRNTSVDWKDFYTGRAIQNYTPPWGNFNGIGGNGENCAYLLRGNIWDIG